MEDGDASLVGCSARRITFGDEMSGNLGGDLLVLCDGCESEWVEGLGIVPLRLAGCSGVTSGGNKQLYDGEAPCQNGEL